jgi:hypothetical protein
MRTVRFERNILGQSTGEQQGDVKIESQYDSLGLRSSVRSSLGAAFDYGRNAMGEVSPVSAGDYQVKFQRDALGLELEREFSGGLRSRWYRDRLQQIDDSQHGLTGGTWPGRSILMVPCFSGCPMQ